MLLKDLMRSEKRQGDELLLIPPSMEALLAVIARHTAGVHGRMAEWRNCALAIKQRDSHLSGPELASNLGFGHKSKITAVHVEGSVNPADFLAAGTPAGTSS
ncbi:hypothetical protein Q8A67_021260 [Cirrhinus molitorella]|uniref:Uncharacterized protein n=1 Tax=Cirrhinus molitorella TaxID=172907 RepID=A0AA88TFZ1_9TELE|nr:hypothetical protein Q8A67_021260 [Cirrhinus molitorella]